MLGQGPPFILMAALVVVLFAVLILNDLLKRRSAERAESEGRRARPDLYNNRTSWFRMLVIAGGLLAYFYLLNHPELTNRDFGPFTPIARWLFKPPK